ncbi:MAG TPA: PepSY domain-containing protein [Caldithrix sp.]|nr:PepSY domain-containing protein [Caldithrix sp.]
MLRKIFKKSKWIHMWFGLPLILFLIWMSASGILLNHPDWIAGFSVPAKFIPDSYIPQNWNRSSMIGMVFSLNDTNVVYAYGKQGIWRSRDGGYTFNRFENGFESSEYYKKTKYLYQSENFLLAATDGGLYFNDLNNVVWQEVKLGSGREALRKILTIQNNLVVITESNAYISAGRYPKFDFQKINWSRSEPDRRVTLIDLFFHLHDGRVWGLPGRLLFDFAGLIIIFLSFGAFYIWYFPNRMKRLKKKNIKFDVRNKSWAFRFFYKYHLKLGIWMAVILFIIGGTGFFMRPPVLALIAEGRVPAWMYPGLLPENPWEKKVHNALHDPVENKILISTADGIWEGPADFNKPFVKRELNAPVFVMGPTVFETYGTGGYLIGSFNGLFHLERSTNRPVNMLNGNYTSEWSNVQPAEYMITGYFKTPSGKEYITTHDQGLLPLSFQFQSNNKRFVMPKEMIRDYRTPLWNFMFELHNGRIFKDWIGGIYILLVPLGSLLFILIILSGVYDWLILWQIKRKTRRVKLR